ncbi:MAG: hypothetical protein J7497_09390 [Chitinophagaceae bacterium]|nr:hypothetical protein [Chitinophagaceae bacterium]
MKLFCENIIDERIAATKALMNNAQMAANNEGKSSAGDKYETSRAMSHLEKDMHARQLMNHLNELAAVRAVKVDIIYSTVVAGAVVECATGTFFISAGLGKQFVDDVPVIFLSPQSPLAKKMNSRRVGDIISYNGEEKITAIY